VANTLDLPPEGRGGGVQFETPYCGISQGYAINCTPAAKDFVDSTGWRNITGNPFSVMTLAKCGSVGLTEQRARDVLQLRLKATEQRAVESIFSRGLFGQAPGLSTSGATALAGVAANVVLAFNLLEAFLAANYGPTGVIHVPANMSAITKRHNLVEKQGAVWRTVMGTAVSFGNYLGYSPADVAPAATTMWIYATGQVSIWSTPDAQVFTTPWGPTLDRSTNQWTGEASREYVVTYECVAAAVETTIAGCC
jgi:hypothetical protein